MCGRYVLYETDKLANRFTADPSQLLKTTASYNMAPGQHLPVVTQAKAKRELNLMRWGLIPTWAKESSIGYKLINARSESVFDKPTWKRPIQRYRCLIPANGFYEWQATDQGKQPFYIHLLDQELFAFAGIYDNWTDHSTGEVIESFSILTTEPNKDMRDIHNRMPVILKPNDEAAWLEPSMTEPEAIGQFLKPYKDGQLEIYSISKDVGNVRNNDKSLIVPLS